MTDILATLPIHWRYFVKTRLMEAIHAEGSARAEVEAAFHALAAALPQLRSLLAAAE